MPAQAVTKECAQKALAELERAAEAAQESQDIPFEYLGVSSTGEDVVNDVKCKWFDVSFRKQ